MRKLLLLLAVPSVMMLTACSSHYQLTDVSRTRILIDKTYDAAPDAAAAAFLAPYKEAVDSVMGPVVGEVARDMAAERPESTLSNLLPDIFMHMAQHYNEKPDFAVYNMGGIRAALSKGKVTYGDVLDVAPFENKICFLTLSGEKVLELFSQIAMRGGEGVSKGVQLVITKDGQLLSEGNDGMPAFKSGTDLNSPKDDKNNARYVITDYFREMMKAGKAVDAKVEGRIIIR